MKTQLLFVSLIAFAAVSMQAAQPPLPTPPSLTNYGKSAHPPTHKIITVSVELTDDEDSSIAHARAQAKLDAMLKQQARINFLLTKEYESQMKANFYERRNLGGATPNASTPAAVISQNVTTPSNFLPELSLEKRTVITERFLRKAMQLAKEEREKLNAVKQDLAKIAQITRSLKNIAGIATTSTNVSE